MIELTITNINDVANRHSGHMSVAAGRAMGANISGKVRNEVAKRISESLQQNDIEAEVSPTGSNRIGIDITDTSQAAKKQGWMAWIFSKVFTGTVEQQIAERLQKELKRHGVNVDINVD